MQSIVPPPTLTQAQARPAPVSICPLCGLAADNGILVRSELTATATYVCTDAHLWSVTWAETA